MSLQTGSERVRSGLSLGLEYTGLGLLALMASGPFLLPFHTEPIPSFWGEWWAGALGLCATAMILSAGRKVEVGLPHGIPATLLLALLIQLITGRLLFAHVGMLYAAYILWGSLLLTLGLHARTSGGLVRLSLALATGFFVGSTIAAMIGLAQWLEIAESTGWVFPGNNGGTFGNLAQANHFAHYLWLGIASSYYLYWRGRIPRGVFWIATALLLAVSALSGSRSVFAYPVVIAAAVYFAHTRSSKILSLPQRIDALALLPALIVFSFAGSWLSEYVPNPHALSADRLYREVSGGSVRFALARAAMPGILEHPLVGIGVGNFPWESFQAAVARVDGLPVQVAEHAHNMVLQLLVEFGVPATLGVLCLGCVWAWRLFAAEWSKELVWCVAVLGIGLFHSLVEYPLWYSYFLGPMAILVGATSITRGYAVRGLRAVAYLVVLLTTGLLILAQLRLDFSRIEAAIYRPLSVHSDREYAWRSSMSQLQEVHRKSLLAPWALLAFAEAATPSRFQADARATICQRSIRFTPARPLLVRCAIQLAIADETPAATRIANATMAAFPNEKEATLKELQVALEQFPEIRALVDAIDYAGSTTRQRL